MKFTIRKREFSQALQNIQRASREVGEYSPTYDRVFVKVTYGRVILLGFGKEGELRVKFDGDGPNSPVSREMENGSVAFILGSIPSKFETGKRDTEKVTVVYTPGARSVFLESEGEKLERVAYRDDSVWNQEIKQAS